MLGNKNDKENPETRLVGEAIAKLFDLPHYVASTIDEDPTALKSLMMTIATEGLTANQQNVIPLLFDYPFPPQAVIDSI